MWAELIYKYEYPADCIRLEFTAPDRLPGKRADIVVFRDALALEPYFVFEVKAADASDSAMAQALEQACGYRAALGASFAGAVSGNTTRRLLRFDDLKKYPAGMRDGNKLTDIPHRYEKPPKWRYYQAVPGKDLVAVPREDLRSAIRKCHQTLWGGGKRSPIVAFGEFCKLVFVKHRDEKNPARPDGEPYAFQSGDGETDAELAQRIHKLYDKEREDEPDVFTDRLLVEDGPLARVVEHLESISLNRTDLDTKGVAFEEFMSGFFKGDFGQYFTPREPIAFAIELLAPKRTDFTIDPACGSGGFLLYALDHVRREADKIFPKHRTDPAQFKKHFDYWHEYAEKRLFGIEVNDELARVAKMNMIIHDDGHTNIVGNDALDFMTKLGTKNPGLAPDKFDLVFTNPPFGAVVKRTEVAEGYIEQYELRRFLSKNANARPGDPADVDADDAAGKRGAASLKERASIKTEILFLERLHTFLKPGTGRAAVVLPDGILTNSSLQGVRDWLLLHFQVLGVVSLPQFAFAHYDAGVKTSILFLRKLNPGETVATKEPIFMALADNIGYDATGRPTYVVSVESVIPEKEKIEQHACDLFTYRVWFDWNNLDPKKTGWTERHREIMPNTGLVGQYKAFKSSPLPFFV